MGIELECKFTGIQKKQCSKKKKKSAAIANVETHKQCSKKKKKKKKKSSAIANVETTSKAICKKEKNAQLIAPRRRTNLQLQEGRKKERKKMVLCAKKKKICNCNGRNQRAMQIDYKKKKKKKKKKTMMMLVISDDVAGMGFRECKQACRLHPRTDGDLEEESER
jgi:hypothetical protein